MRSLSKYGNGAKSFALVAAMFLLLSWVNVKPSDTSVGTVDPHAISQVDDEDLTGDDSTTSDGLPGEGPGSADNNTSGGGTSGGSASGGAGTRTAQCNSAGNGGNTAPGVTATKIRLATTAVLDGPGKSLLAPSVTGIKAVLDKVKREGGICGRQLSLNVVNDSFDSQRGSQFIRNFIAEGYFALPVVPSAEGLGVAITSGEISKAKIPVVGTDGMREEQYGDPWVWPVASATVSTMRIMAKYGFQQKKATTFSLVWDNKYKFGQEGKDAFIKQVQSMGGKMVYDQPLDPAQTAYASEAAAFNDKCGGGKCDMVAMLLLPDTAKAWMARNPAKGRLYTSGAQTLFTNDFAQKCVQAAPTLCDSFAVWTGFNPPIGPIATTPGVTRYISDVRALDPSIDVNNQFLQGAYLGMSVFTEALKKVGPTLTRDRLREVMDSMDYTTDLASGLSWRPGKHAANARARAFAMSVTQGTFNGWRDEGTGFLLDPLHGG